MRASEKTFSVTFVLDIDGIKDTLREEDGWEEILILVVHGRGWGIGGGGSVLWRREVINSPKVKESIR